MDIILRERTLATHWIWCWVGSTAGLDVLEKTFLSLARIEPRTIQLVTELFKFNRILFCMFLFLSLSYLHLPHFSCIRFPHLRFARPMIIYHHSFPTLTCVTLEVTHITYSPSSMHRFAPQVNEVLHFYVCRNSTHYPPNTYTECRKSHLAIDV